MSKSIIDDRLASAKAVRRLLIEVIADPSGYLEAPFANHLKRQASLASFSDSELGIEGCSLNTFKNACRHVEGGFARMDVLRREACQVLQDERERQSIVPRTTKAVLTSRVEQLKSDLDAAHEDLILLSSMLDRALRYGRQYAIDSNLPALLERCAREQAEVRDMMTLRKTKAAARLKLVKDQDAS